MMSPTPFAGSKAEFLNIAPTQLVSETTLALVALLNSANYPIRRTLDAATVALNPDNRTLLQDAT